MTVAVRGDQQAVLTDHAASVRPAPCPSFLQSHPCPIVQPRGAGSTALRPSSDHGQTPAYQEHRGTPTCVCPVRVTRQGRHLPTVDFPWRNASPPPNNSLAVVRSPCCCVVRCTAIQCAVLHLD